MSSTITLPEMETSPTEPADVLDIPGLSHILTPGSSLHPTFLLLVDGVFASLLFILFLLAFITRSVHFLALILISMGLWASVKW